MYNLEQPRGRPKALYIEVLIMQEDDTNQRRRGMPWWGWLVLAAVLALAALYFLGKNASAADQSQLVIQGGPDGGTYNKLATNLAALVEDSIALPTDGSLANIQGVCSSPTTHVGFVQDDVAKRLSLLTEQELADLGVCKELRYVGSFGKECGMLAVRRGGDLQTIYDLVDGRANGNPFRIVIGYPEAGGNSTFHTLMSMIPEIRDHVEPIQDSDGDIAFSYLTFYSRDATMPARSFLGKYRFGSCYQQARAVNLAHMASNADTRVTGHYYCSTILWQKNQSLHDHRRSQSSRPASFDDVFDVVASTATCVTLICVEFASVSSQTKGRSLVSRSLLGKPYSELL